MKCIDEEIPFEIPESWEWCRLGSIVQHNTGKTLDKDRNTGKLFEYITTSNVYWEGFELNTLKSMLIEENNIDRFTVRKGDLLVCEGGDSGRSSVWEYERTICFQNHVHRVRPYLNIESWYIYFFLHKIYLSKEIEQYKRGVGIQSLSGDALSSILLPLPPIKEQKRIIEEVKQCGSFVETIELNQTDLQQFITQAKSKILDLAIRGKLVPQDPNDEPASALLKRIKAEHPESKKKTKNTSDNSHYHFEIPETWELVNLGLLFDIVSGKRVLKLEWTREGVPFYRVREIVRLSESGYVENDLFISNNHFDLLKSNYGVPVKGDIMLSAVGSIGKTYIVKETDCFYYKDASVLCLKNLFKLDSLFYSLVVQSSFLQNQIYEKSKGTTVDTITIENAKNFKVPLPPIQEQTRIVKKIEETFAYLDEIANSIKA